MKVANAKLQASGVWNLFESENKLSIRGTAIQAEDDAEEFMPDEEEVDQEAQLSPPQAQTPPSVSKTESRAGKLNVTGRDKVGQNSADIKDFL